jgi:hypothetical protein
MLISVNLSPITSIPQIIPSIPPIIPALHLMVVVNPIMAF